MKHVIDALKASKRKATHQRDNWKARAIALEKELNAYKVWAAKVDRWHRNCARCAVSSRCIPPKNNLAAVPCVQTVHGAGQQPAPANETDAKIAALFC